MEQTLILEEKLVKMQERMARHRNRANSVEEILTAVRPMLDEYKLALVINDTVECKGARYYVKAIVRLISPDCERVVATTGEAEHVGGKKGGNTEVASETARLSALTGMFAL